MDLAPRATSEELSRVMGDAVVRIWGQLPHDVQYHLFEAALISHGEQTRPQLAVFLHEKHSRTCASLKARAMVEPDSLGG